MAVNDYTGFTIEELEAEQVAIAKAIAALEDAKAAKDKELKTTVSDAVAPLGDVLGPDSPSNASSASLSEILVYKPAEASDLAGDLVLALAGMLATVTATVQDLAEIEKLKGA